MGCESRLFLPVIFSSASLHGSGVKVPVVDGVCLPNSECSDIQSSSVEPIPEPELISKFEGRNVMEQVVRFFRTNHVRRFMLKRPFHKGQRDKTNEYKTLHVERIIYTTSHRFPNILRWFEVKSTDVVS